VKNFALDAKSLVVDVGCNDGTLLRAVKSHGVRVLGVEPTDMAKVAAAAGVPVVQQPFTEAVAAEIVREHGEASMMTATNVFAHMAPLGEVLRGAQRLLKSDGLFMTETHYLLDVLRTAQYDTIYHEHLRTYSLRSLVVLYEQYGFTVVDAVRVDRYAGTLRVFAQKGKDRPVKASVGELLAQEQAFGLDKPEVYTRFRNQTYEAKDRLLEFALRAKEKGERLVGNSCPGRCSTLLNFTGITPDLMPYIAEQPTSMKLGLHLPGRHMPVVDNEILFREQPEYVVLLAWHYEKPIKKLLRERGLKSKLVMPLPEFRILAD
jgi:hypothetical protein